MSCNFHYHTFSNFGPPHAGIKCMSEIVECKPVFDISSIRYFGLLASLFHPLPDIPKGLAPVKENIIVMDRVGGIRVTLTNFVKHNTLGIFR